ncbi:hypothetical protein ACI784_15265 [Geodermatophilus sp. SYSU D01186]
MADYWTALRRHSSLRQEISRARMRIGQAPLGPMPPGNSTEVEPAALVDLILDAAGRFATDRVSAELAELYASREAAAERG